METLRAVLNAVLVLLCIVVALVMCMVVVYAGAFIAIAGAALLVATLIYLCIHAWITGDNEKPP